MPFLWLLMGFGGGFAVGYSVGKKAEPESQPQPLPAPPPINTLPPPPTGGYQFPGTLGVPPQQWPIPGGFYITGIGWCPPGTVYDLKTKLCVPEIMTQGYETGNCCASCEAGGPCEGCS